MKLNSSLESPPIEFSVPVHHLPIFRNGSSVHMHVLGVYVQQYMPLARELPLKSLDFFTLCETNLEPSNPSVKFSDPGHHPLF